MTTLGLNTSVMVTLGLNTSMTTVTLTSWTSKKSLHFEGAWVTMHVSDVFVILL